MFALLGSVNYYSIIISAIVYFVLGAFWYCPLLGTLKLFCIQLPGTLRRKELVRNNIVIKDPSDKEAFLKIVITLCATFIASIAMAFLVTIVDSKTMASGLFLGMLIAIGFSAVTLLISATWENRSFKLIIIDSLCPMIGIILSAIIISILR